MGVKGVKGDIYTKVWLGVGAYTAGKWADDNSWGSVYTRVHYTRPYGFSLRCVQVIIDIREQLI